MADAGVIAGLAGAGDTSDHLPRCARRTVCTIGQRAESREIGTAGAAVATQAMGALLFVVSPLDRLPISKSSSG